LTATAENRIDSVFAARRAAGKKCLAPFVVAGRPTVGALGDTLAALEAGGASLVEIGIPFSDPIADGPVIAEAMHKALQGGATLTGVFDAIRAARERVSLGLVAMASVSIVHRVGEREFVRRAKEAGLDGFIFPDAPLEESDSLLAAAGEAGLTASLLVAPTTPPERAAQIASACTGFVYLLARTGITGERSEAPDVASRVAMLREATDATDLPIACGFGISTAEHVRAVVEHADAAIVGSALVKRVEAAIAAGEDAADAAGAFTRELAAGL